MILRPYLIILQLLILSTFSYAQKGETRVLDSEHWTCQFQKPANLYLTDLEHVENWVKDRFSTEPYSELQLQHTLRSALGTHYSFVQLLEGKIIEGSMIRVHLLPDSRVYLVQSTLCPELPLIGRSMATSESAEWRWIAFNGGLYLTERFIETDGDHDYSYRYNGVELLSNPGKLYFQGPDTTVHGRIFLANPLNSANVSYGAPYADNNDADHPVLDAELKWGTMPAYYSKDTFYFRTKRYIMAELSPPVTAIIKGISDTFDFTRSQDWFEDVNAWYHINAFSAYLDSLGFGAQLPDSLEIDAHAFNGDDRSAFTYNMRPHRLEFGTGGVDDAEDGEVVVHEFGHAISVASAPNTINGIDRKAMEEGNADYWCKSYSREFETGDLNTSKVFSWDGHNEFWEGVKTDVKLIYPIHITNNTRNDRALWSSPLLCMKEAIGKTPADKLVMSHLLLQSSNTLFPQMAMEILALDTLLYGGKHVNQIKQCFSVNGILAPPNPEPPKTDEANIVMFNSLKFAQGLGNMEVLIPGSGIKKVLIFNELGQIHESYEGFLNKILLLHTDYAKGAYFLHAETDGYTEVRRFVKLD
ncbi:MAG: hypothetical protein H6606_08515 [Flavobacteriales bacterium]|nr:hypothetical protein [Flavobacteriales bacterium]